MEMEMATLWTVFIIAAINVDENGYLLQPDSWNKEVAQLLAQGVVPEGLTEEHWKVISYLRQYYLMFGIVPPVRKLCRDTEISLSKVYKLFPLGLARGACKIAGIPKAMFLHPLARLYP